MKVPNLRLVYVFWLCLWFARLHLIPRYFYRTRELGYYGIADAVILPIVGNGILTIAGAPFFALGLWLLFFVSPVKDVRWLAWNRQRWLVSLLLTLVFGGFTYLSFESLLESIQIRLPFNAVADVGWCLLWLIIRAVAVSKLRPRLPVAAPG